MIPVFLAPMAGYTNAPMRLLCSRFGAERTYTEMANAAGLIHKSDATWQLLETLPEEPLPVAHLYGNDPETFARAAERIAATGRFRGIDINAGCPVPKITRSGAGSTLMRDPKRIGAIVAAIRRACDLPVTVKTRIGFSPSEITVFDVLAEVEAAGGAALAIHGRTRAQGHAGPVAHDIVAEVKRRATIPVYGNGGIRDFGSAADYAARTGVDALLVGQAAIGHPWTFSDIRDGVTYRVTDSRTLALPLEEIRRVLFEHINLELAFVKAIKAKYPDSAPIESPEEVTVIRFRCDLFRYLSGLMGSAQMRGRMVTTKTLDEVRSIVDDCLACEAARRARRAERLEEIRAAGKPTDDGDSRG